ncbi:hypothetical protein R6Q59_011918 [Mikania micrantha]
MEYKGSIDEDEVTTGLKVGIPLFSFNRSLVTRSAPVWLYFLVFSRYHFFVSQSQFLLAAQLGVEDSAVFRSTSAARWLGQFMLTANPIGFLNFVALCLDADCSHFIVNWFTIG